MRRFSEQTPLSLLLNSYPGCMAGANIIEDAHFSVIAPELHFWTAILIVYTGSLT